MTLTLRAEIINQYRDRIHKAAHVRLTKDELEALIDGFIAELRGAKTEKKIQTLCETEIKLLEEGYPQPSVAKYVTRYRRAITAAIEDGTLPLTKANSHRYIHQQRVTGVQEERLEHWALTYFKYSQEVYENIDKRSQLTNRDKQLNLRLVPVAQYLALLREFLEKKGLFEARWLATAIAGLTGRRFAEVVAKGTFSLTEHPYLLRFQGQLKSRAGHGEGYDIVTLFPAAEVLEAIERLRKLPEVKAITKLKGAALSTALNTYNQKLNAVTGKVLIKVVPPLEGKKAVSVHNLRSLYGAIAVYFFCPEHQHEYAFVQHFLGHVMDSPATGHYFRYALRDDQGRLLRDKGILLDQVQELPLGRALEEPLMVEIDTPVQGALELPLSDIAVAIEAKPQQNRIRKTKGTEIVRETAIAVGDGGTPQIALDEWCAELEQRLEQMRTEFEAQLQELRQESNVGWFVRRVEGLERENLALRLERDRAIEAAQNANEAEVVRLNTENLALAQKLKLAQDKLEGFRQLLNGDTSTTDQERDSNADSNSIDAPDPNPILTVRDNPSDPAEPLSEPQDKPVQFTQAKPHPLRVPASGIRGPKTGKAFKRAEAIVLAIKDWNRRYPSESFAINAGLLETVFRIHRQAVKAFFDTYQNELWDYHQDLGVESPRWHNRGKDPQKLKDFVNQRV